MTTRRGFIALACGALAGAAQAQLPADIAARRRTALEQAIAAVTGGTPVQQGRVKLDIAPLIDNGNTVPLSVTVQSPMTPEDHVTSIHVLTEKNPQPRIIDAYLGPRAGRARIATRARIADSGTVIAIARMSDGSAWSDRAQVVVTLSACLEDGLI